MTLLLAAVLHLPLTPLVPLVRMLRTLAILREPDKDWDYKPEDLSVPIELVEPAKVEPKPAGPDNAVTLPTAPVPPDPPKVGDKPQADAKKTAAEKAEARRAEKEAVAAKAREKKDRDRQEKDGKEKQARAEKAAADRAKLGPTDPVLPEEEEKTGEAADATGARPADTSAPVSTKKPGPRALGLAGTLSDRVAGKPNVSFALWLSGVREHPLGGAAGEIIACNPEWRPFLQKGIKPMDDLEGMLMVGPQLGNSAKFLVAVQHRLTPDRLHDVIDALVQRSGKGGGWLTEEVARVMVQRRERVIFTHPKDMLFVSPPESWEAIHALKGPLSLPAARGRALSLTLLSPARPLKKLGLSLPQRLGELRLEVFGNADGTVDVRIEFDDESEASAAADAPQVTQTLDTFFSDLAQVAQTVTSLAPASLTGGADDATLPLPKVDFSPVERHITSTLRLSAAQSGKMLGLLARAMCPKAKVAAPVVSAGR